MDKRLSIYDVVMIAKATVTLPTEVSAFANALVKGLEEQEVQKVKTKAEFLRRELENMVNGRPTGEGLDYFATKAPDLVQDAIGLPSAEVAGAAPFNNRGWKSKPAAGGSFEHGNPRAG